MFGVWVSEIKSTSALFLLQIVDLYTEKNARSDSEPSICLPTISHWCTGSALHWRFSQSVLLQRLGSSISVLLQELYRYMHSWSFNGPECPRPSKLNLHPINMLIQKKYKHPTATSRATHIKWFRLYLSWLPTLFNHWTPNDWMKHHCHSKLYNKTSLH